MAACPNCQTENNADFGLVNCISCGKAFLVEIDGQVRAADAPAFEAQSTSSESQPQDPPSQAAHQLTDFLIEDLASSSSASVTNSEHPPPIEASLATPSEDIFSLPTEDVPAPIVAAAVKENLADMREVANFGNSDVSLAREGAYRFNLFIYGIDSTDIRQEVKDALTDGRFLWDLESLLNQIDQGVLKLNDLSAVKSALVVQRLKTLPVDIKWEQYAIHQS